MSSSPVNSYFETLKHAIASESASAVLVVVMSGALIALGYFYWRMKTENEELSKKHRNEDDERIKKLEVEITESKKKAHEEMARLKMKLEEEFTESKEKRHEEIARLKMKLEEKYEKIEMKQEKYENKQEKELQDTKTKLEESAKKVWEQSETICELKVELERTKFELQKTERKLVFEKQQRENVTREPNMMEGADDHQEQPGNRPIEESMPSESERVYKQE